MTPPMLSIQNLSKTYKSGFQALKDVNFEVKKGEILALLGPNGAGKTTLISIVCGLVNSTSGRVLIDGFDNVSQFRQARQLVGLVPQELTTDAFETPWNNLHFSRGLFGLATDNQKVESVLKALSLWDKKDARIMSLSGGMKRRLLIAKALVHDPKLLFLDEPTAGVDVTLRQDMWGMVARLREQGVTIVLTTHYIEEAEAIADRVGVIAEGQLKLVQDKDTLMQSMGQKQLTVDLCEPIQEVPQDLAELGFELTQKGQQLRFHYRSNDEKIQVGQLLAHISESNVKVADIRTKQSSLEEIMIELLEESA